MGLKEVVVKQVSDGLGISAEEAKAFLEMPLCERRAYVESIRGEPCKFYYASLGREAN